MSAFNGSSKAIVSSVAYDDDGIFGFITYSRAYECYNVFVFRDGVMVRNEVFNIQDDAEKWLHSEARDVRFG